MLQKTLWQSSKVKEEPEEEDEEIQKESQDRRGTYEAKGETPKEIREIERCDEEAGEQEYEETLSCTFHEKL